MKKIIAILMFCGLFNSCSKDNKAEKTESLIASINVSFFNASFSNDTYTFKYDKNHRLTQRTGGFITIGGSNVFSKEIYTSITYNGNEATVEDYSSSNNFSVIKNPIYYILNNNKISQKDFSNKRQSYRYNGENLVEIVTTFPNRIVPPNDLNAYTLTYSENLYYDNNGNLTKTEYIEKRNGIEKGIKIIRTFEDFDKSINPVKRFFLLDEHFYRSISKNNFRKYSEAFYLDGIVTQTSEKKWTFNYDSMGNIIIN